MCPSLAEPDSVDFSRRKLPATGRQRSDSAEPHADGFSKSIVFNRKPQANKKFFGAAVFQKCCRGVGEQPTFAKQMKPYNEIKQTSKKQSEESQLPLKSRGCN